MASVSQGREEGTGLDGGEPVGEPGFHQRRGGGRIETLAIKQALEQARPGRGGGGGGAAHGRGAGSPPG
jgi:hypothetical protein